MVNLHTKNKKLTERGVGILENATGLDRRTAGKLLAVAGGPRACRHGHGRKLASAARMLRLP